MLSYLINYPLEVVKKGVTKTIHIFKDYRLMSSSRNILEIYQEEKNIISLKMEAYFEDQTQLFIDLRKMFGQYDESEILSYANLFFTRLNHVLEQFRTGSK